MDYCLNIKTSYQKKSSLQSMDNREKESRSDGECESAEEEEVDPRVQVLGLFCRSVLVWIFY